MDKQDIEQERRIRALRQLRDWMKSKTLLSALFELKHPHITRARVNPSDTSTCLGARYDDMRVISVDSIGGSATEVILMEDDRPTWQRKLRSFTARVDFEDGYFHDCGLVRFHFDDGSYASLSDWSNWRAA
jgi:hypothetical protein